MAASMNHADFLFHDMCQHCIELELQDFAQILDSRMAFGVLLGAACAVWYIPHPALQTVCSTAAFAFVVVKAAVAESQGAL